MHPSDLFKDIKDIRLKAYRVFNKNENEVSRDIEIVKKWLESQSHLPEIMKESHILNFLLFNKFSIEKTKQKIDMYYTIRSVIPEFYDECNPKLSQIQQVFETAYICVHPKMVNELCRAYFFKLKKPNVFLPRETILTFCNFGEIRLHEDCLFYDIHVLDLSNLTLNDMSKMTPTIILKVIAIYEKVYSFRFKAVYLINAPKFISNLLTVVKTLVKPKIFDRIHVCENDEILKSLFTAELLPKDYGGHGPSLDELTDAIRNKLDEYQNRFDQLDKMRVNESLRPGELKNDDIMGFYGNFKKLNVD